MIAEGLAEAQVRFPGVPLVFCETRPLAQEWTYRFLGAALDHHDDDSGARRRVLELPAAEPLPARAATPAEIREWARANGHEVSDRGRIPASIVEAHARAQAGSLGPGPG